MKEEDDEQRGIREGAETESRGRKSAKFYRAARRKRRMRAGSRKSE